MPSLFRPDSTVPVIVSEIILISPVCMFPIPVSSKILPPEDPEPENTAT